MKKSPKLSALRWCGIISMARESSKAECGGCAVSLRPHHFLCLALFRGEGYSDAFTRNMEEVSKSLKLGTARARIAGGADDICRRCPKNRGGECETEEKASRFDRAVAELCGLSARPAGHEVLWSEVQAAVFESILGAGKLDEVCADCSWHSICSSILHGGL